MMQARDDSISSERMTLRPFVLPDAGQLLVLFRDSLVRRYLLDDALVSAEWVHDEIVASEARFSGSGAGLWSIRLTDRREIVGFVGFREFFDPPQLQLLYGLLPHYWGRGLATEAARAVCDYAFQSLGFAEVAAATDLPNEASARVLDRLGMTLDRTTDDGPAGTVFYSLDRSCWKAADPVGETT